MESKGKIIVLEGIDGSGKSAQYRKLCARLQSEGVDFRSVEYPRYSEETSSLIRMYLAGQFGENPNDVNPYASSIFYAVDRYASFMTDWKDYYRGGGLMLLDRYTTSNAVHQGAKLPEGEQPAFFDWLYDLEYGKLGLPEPDLVIYLEVDLETSMARTRHRQPASFSRQPAGGWPPACSCFQHKNACSLRTFCSGPFTRSFPATMCPGRPGTENSPHSTASSPLTEKRCSRSRHKTPFPSCPAGSAFRAYSRFMPHSFSCG